MRSVVSGVTLTLASGKLIRSAIIYIRVSTARENMKSPEQQLAICLAFCISRGIRVVGEPVEDLDLSGAGFARRKIASIIERVKNGEADAIVVWEYSRFGRTLVGSLYYIKQLESVGGELLSATQDIDATTPSGRFMRDNFLRLAEYQLDMITEGWKNAHKRRIEAGLPHGGQERFGYSRCPGCYRPEPGSRAYACRNKCGGLLVPEYLLPDEPERVLRSKALAEGYEKIVDGKSWYRVAQDAWHQGVVSLRGNRMDESAWRAVLDSGFAAGLLRGRSDKTQRASNTRPDTYDIWADGAHDALIGQDMWDAYVERRLRQGSPSTRESEPKYPLSSLVRCGDLMADGKPCGLVMKVTGQTRKGAERVRSFTCSRNERHVRDSTLSMSMHRLEAVVKEWLIAMVKGEADLAQISMERAAMAEKSASEIPAVQKLVAELERKKGRINDGYEAGLTDLAEAKSRMELVRVELTDAKAKLDRLRKEAAANSVPEREVFQGLLSVWDRATAEEKRRALRKVVDHVRVTPPTVSDTAGSHAMVVPLWADASLRIADKRLASRTA